MEYKALVHLEDKYVLNVLGNEYSAFKTNLKIEEFIEKIKDFIDNEPGGITVNYFAIFPCNFNASFKVAKEDLKKIWEKLEEVK